MFDITIRRDGDAEPFTVDAGTRDVLRWEKTNRKQRKLADLQNDYSIVDFYTIAFYACQRTGKFAGDLAEFERTCEIEVEEQDDEPDPTQQGHST